MRQRIDALLFACALLAIGVLCAVEAWWGQSPGPLALLAFLVVALLAVVVGRIVEWRRGA
jgi:hypothetical protein